MASARSSELTLLTSLRRSTCARNCASSLTTARFRSGTMLKSSSAFSSVKTSCLAASTHSGYTAGRARVSAAPRRARARTRTLVGDERLCELAQPLLEQPRRRVRRCGLDLVVAGVEGAVHRVDLALVGGDAENAFGLGALRARARVSERARERARDRDTHSQRLDRLDERGEDDGQLSLRVHARLRAHHLVQRHAKDALPLALGLHRAWARAPRQRESQGAERLADTHRPSDWRAARRGQSASRTRTESLRAARREPRAARARTRVVDTRGVSSSGGRACVCVCARASLPCR